MSVGDVLAVLELPMLLQELESTAAGRLSEQQVAPGDLVRPGQSVALIDTTGVEQNPRPKTDRERRVNLYCCPGMFYAVAESASQETKLSFTFFRGDPCWCINDDYAFIKFCPWCGSHLPNHPFEPTEEEKSGF